MKSIVHQPFGDVFDRHGLVTAQIENALERIREGSYGACDGCTKSIPLARLQALPYAVFCIDCQREVEKNGGPDGNPADWGRVIDLDSGDNDVVLNDIEVDVP